MAGYYEQHGPVDGEPVLLLHGGHCSIETWAPQVEALSPRYRVHAPERPGHGRTADRPGPFTFRAMVDDTVAYLDAVGLERVHVVGFSDGAITGLMLALEHPQRVRSLVSISANLDPSVFDDGDEPAAGGDPEEDPEDAAYARLSPDGPAHLEVVVGKLVAMWQVEPQIDPADLARVGAPTLVLAGDRDSIPTTHTVGIARAVPGAQLCIVPGAGHLVIREKPDLVNRAIEDFLAGLGRVSASRQPV
ncbi:alpha/beta hydrolase [Nocardioides currus]|uniref:Alpha/beta hydrolase n=1 Tax=Nocardioides currus TaxID=2133958 RepID=A0A2R7YS71_9ACTN|nr:alpha/beta hydrolase [Nocardioides currus]